MAVLILAIFIAVPDRGTSSNAMHQNLLAGGGLHVIAFPLAAGVLCSFVLIAQVAALSMSGSTLLVAITAGMLKRTKLAGIHKPGKNAMPAAPGGPGTQKRAKAVRGAGKPAA